MDVLQMSHVRSTRGLARLMRGTLSPLVVAEGSDEVMVVMTPAAFEAVLLGTSRPAVAPESVFNRIGRLPRGSKRC